MKVSVVIPVYNERAFIEEVLLRVQASPIEKEIILVDDKSTDGTRGLLEDLDKAQSEGKREVTVQNGKSPPVARKYTLPVSTPKRRKGSRVAARIRGGHGRHRSGAGRRS